MVHCIVPFCNSDSRSEKVSFHQIPSNADLREKWLSAISREGECKGSQWVPTQYSSVCGKHFAEVDFKPFVSRKILKPDAVPSIFQNYPQYMVVKKGPKRRVLVRNEVLQHANSANNTGIAMLSEVCCMQEPLSMPSTSNNMSLQETPTISEEISHPITSEEGIRPSLKLAALRRKCKNLQSTLSKMRKKIKQLRSKNSVLKNSLTKCSDTLKDSNIEGILQLSSEGDMRATFLIDQVKLFHKLKPRWSEISIRYCILWQSRSPSGYRYIRNLGLLKLPSESTLKKYLGCGLVETGFSSLIKQRLEMEKKNTSGMSLLGSLIIDEMTIKPMLRYDKMRDKLFGTVDLAGKEIELGLEKKLAKHLLCFMFSGLCSSFKMPIAYYFTLELTGSQLYSLVLNVLEEFEKTGFKVLRIVTDNLKVNSTMFKKLCGVKELEEINHEIVHPFDPERKLFLSYDYCHIIKNIRNQFLSKKKSFIINGKPVSSSYVEQLYELNRKEIIKPVRRLTFKHMYPTSFEKMNVQRAIDIFSPEVTSVLKFMSSDYFKNAGETIDFMEKIYRWFAIHDVHNKTQHIHQNKPDSMHFFAITDERLDWLEDDFIGYLKDWKTSCTNVKIQCLSKETYNAAILTTLSTVNCIKYLLNSGIQYVLPRKFSSDVVESFFGFLRQIGGRNDMCNALSISNAMSKVVKTGIVSKSVSSETLPPSNSSLLKSHKISKTTLKNTNTNDVTEKIKDILQHDLLQLEKLIHSSRATLQIATIAYVAGYLVRIVSEHVSCVECLSLIATDKSPSPCNAIIRFLDRDGPHGGLKYPKLEFITVINFLDQCAKKVLESISLKTNVVQQLLAVFLPHLCKNPMFRCSVDSDGSHTNEVCMLILKKFLRPYISNYGYRCTEENNIKIKKSVKKKPLNRKILKV